MTLEKIRFVFQVVGIPLALKTSSLAGGGPGCDGCLSEYQDNSSTDSLSMRRGYGEGKKEITYSIYMYFLDKKEGGKNFFTH